MATARVDPRFEVTGFGEALLRLSVGLGQRLETAASYAVHVAGAEINVMAALAGLGRRVAWGGGLPEGRMGERVLRHLRAFGVAADGVVNVPGARLGTYYVELASAPRRTDVIYDRAGSAATRVRVADVPWEALLDTSVVHLTGITPALGADAAAVVTEAVRRAQAAGVKVSFDVNFRAKLWSADAAARTLTPLLDSVDLLVCGEADAAAVFGLSGAVEDVVDGLAKLAPRAVVVLTSGERGASALVENTLVTAPGVPVDVRDGLGAGDALTAGVIDGWLAGSLDAGLRQGVALASMALASDGDALVVTRPELESVMGTGRRVQR
jgi:2-dehydro-3-deoxygluconokinase